MLFPREFLLEECENVSRLLRNTLRYAYSSKSSEKVYGECLARLRLIRSRITATKDQDFDRLNELSVQLSYLSELIGRVERSHIEEFSWPFAAALQKLAADVCAPTEEDANSPLFFISADDELFSYRIRTEEDDPGLIDRTLFNIIFPRSLKHFVLLHPILGHEVGHAAYAIPELGAELETIVTHSLIAKSPLTDLSKFELWVKRSGSSLDADEVTQAALSWPEELYCDLFGLLFMGPSYVAANCTVLLGLQEPSNSHPGSLTRYWMMNEAIKHLGWREASVGRRGYLKQPVTSYFDSVAKIADQVPRKQQLLDTKSISSALENLKKILRTKGDALFKMPDASSIKRMVDRILRARPPVESNVSKTSDVSNEAVDFRAILYAGWLAWYSERRRHSQLDFFTLNQLCDRGLLQQSAVDRWTAYKKPEAQHVSS